MNCGRGFVTLAQGGITTIPVEKKCKKAKSLNEEHLQIAVKGREGIAKETRKDIFIFMWNSKK